MQLFSASPAAHVDLAGAVLVLPAVAHANIGELAIDCLIASYDLPLVARLEDDNILPCVGNDAYKLQPPGTLATALELYHHAATNTFFLQQRAPAITGRQDAFATSVAEWIKSSRFATVIVLCGLDAQFRRDAQLADRAARFLASSETASETLTNPNLKPLEDAQLETEQQLHPLLPPWTTLRALKVSELDYVVVMRYAAEGDNMPDAVTLAQDAHRVLRVLRGEQQQAAAGGEEEGKLGVKMPCSWSALYGRSLPRYMHGG